MTTIISIITISSIISTISTIAIITIIAMITIIAIITSITTIEARKEDAPVHLTTLAKLSTLFPVIQRCGSALGSPT